ncbi:MAG: hypothetical protein M3R63_10950 [Actinomycetota bacterium]|nr:hypothetical protein [Actinomycetota bacterium]
MSTVITPQCTCEIVGAGMRHEYRCLDRSCPVHGDEATERACRQRADDIESGPLTWERDQLALLLDALAGVAISDAERHSLTWLAGWECHTIENIAAVIRRARAAGEPARACLWCSTRPAPHIVLGDPLCQSCYRDHRSEVTTSG